MPDTCTATRTNGERCASTLGLRNGLCPVHDGRADPRAAAMRKHQLDAERRKETRKEVERARLAPRDRLRLALAERWDEVQMVLLDGALEDGDRGTLIRLMAEAFGKPGEVAPPPVEPEPSLEELFAALDALQAGTPVVHPASEGRMGAGVEA